MSNFAALDLLGLIAAGGLAIAGTGLGAAVAIGGTLGFQKVSQFFASKEREYPDKSWGATACKISKWSALAFGALLGTTGTAVFGLSLLVGMSIITFGTMPGVTLAVGFGAAFLMQAFVIHRTVSQCIKNSCIS
jgi:hypothetical protein